MKRETGKRLEELLKNAIEREELTGGNLLVMKDGREVCYLEDGMADREKGISVERNTLFRLYSMSKPVTAAAAMLLFQEGELDLGEPVSSYLPGFKGQQVDEGGKLVSPNREVLVRDLLSMTSGLVYPDAPGAAGCAATALFKEVSERLLTPDAMTTVEIANALGSCPLLFHPGSIWNYGSSADVLGAIVEVVSGMSFGQFLHTYLFEPLEMNDTDFYVPAEKRCRFAAAYARDERGRLVRYEGNHLCIINEMDRQPAFESGGAGLVSTIMDYSRFAQMLLQDGIWKGKQILKPAAVRYLTTTRLLAFQQQSFEQGFNQPGYTYGNLMRVMDDHRRANVLGSDGEYGWDGWLGGCFANSPQDHMTILFMMQKTDTGMPSLMRKMKNIIMSDIHSVGGIYEKV